jgi:hypothetical protein
VKPKMQSRSWAQRVVGPLVPGFMCLSSFECGEGASARRIWALGIDPAPRKKLLWFGVDLYELLTHARLNFAYKIIGVLDPICIRLSKLNLVVTNLSKAIICHFVFIPNRVVRGVHMRSNRGLADHGERWPSGLHGKRVLTVGN